MLRLIVLGGGFAGVKCAKTLRKRFPASEAEIIVFNEENHLVFSPMLADAVGSSLSPLDVVARFERLTGRPFQREHVPEPVLRAQFEQATDSLQKSFAALMLGYLLGDAMDMQPIVEQFGIKLASVDEYAHSVLRLAAGA